MQLTSLFESLTPTKEQKSAWEQLLKLGMPTKRNAPYLPLNRFYGEEFSLMELKLPQISASDELIILPISQAKKRYGALLQNAFAKSLSREKNAFALLPFALLTDGLFIYVPPKVKLEKPLTLIFPKSEKGKLMPSKVQLFVGAGAELEIVVRNASSGWNNQLFEVQLEEGAKLNQLNFSHVDSDSYLFDHQRVTLKKDSHFSSLNFTLGAKSVWQDFQVRLEGEGSSADLRGGYWLSEKREAHTKVLIEHLAPHTQSHQHFKGVLQGKSRASFEGKIFVEKEAQKTEAYQLSNHLLLSDEAIARSLPNLEIFADDVKASHGATTAQVDREMLHYLCTRGISEKEAKRLLVRAFWQELLDQISDPELRREVSDATKI